MMPVRGGGVVDDHMTNTPSRRLFQVRSRVLLDASVVEEEQQQQQPWREAVLDRRSSNNNNHKNLVTNCDDVRDTPEDCRSDPHILFDPLTKIPMEYTCRSDLDNENNDDIDDDDLRVAETWVQVDYEALIPIQADAKYNERQLQWRVLLAAVEEVGLDRCDFSKQRRPPPLDDDNGIDNESDTTTSTTTITPPRLRRGRRQRQRQRHLEEYSTAATTITAGAGLPSNLTIYAIENDLASSFAFPIPCQYLATTEDIPDVQCLPVRTVLKLKYYHHDDSLSTRNNNNETATTRTDDDPAAEGLVQAHVQHLLQTNLEDRTQSLYVGDVMGLYYVGTHNLDAVLFVDDNIQTGNKDHKIAPGVDDPSIVRIGSFVSAASAIVLLLFLFAVRRRRQRQSGNDSSSTKPATSQAMGVVVLGVEEEEDGDDLSMQLPLDMMQAETLDAPYCITSSSSSSTNVSQDSSEEPSLRHDHTLLYDQKEHDLMVDNDIASIFRSSSSDLPPRPPTSSSSSRVVANTTTTSRRRRKKKRRKRPTLQRVNSREGIHTMAAIPEVGSGDDDDDDDKNENEDDRYYSSTEEENEASSSSSSRASSSGYNTPVGPDEEDASPRTRQRFPSDPDAADAERILETLHFHLGTTTTTTPHENDDDDIQRCTTLKTSNKAVAITTTTTTSSSWELEPSSPQSISSNSHRRSFRSSLSGWF